jgi:hypothetical protein
MSRCGTLSGYFTIGGGVLKCATSLPVNTAWTPGERSAASTLIERMFA